MPPLMIFAAGLGTRMRPLTDLRPKPLIEVAGRSLLDRALDLGRAAGAGPIVVNTHYLGAQIERHLQGQDVALSPEAGQILDTGGGLRQALPLLGAGAVMVNAFAQGLDTVRALREAELGVPIFAHRVGAALWAAAEDAARAAGATAMYVSATPTGPAVGLYLRQGCRLADPVHPALYANEPDDIHLLKQLT